MFSKPVFSKPDIRSLAYYPCSSGYFKLLAQLPNPVWLDCGSPSTIAGRFDILSADPKKILAHVSAENIQDEVDELARTLDDLEALDELPFIGGAIGYFDYEHNHKKYDLLNDNTNNYSNHFGIFDWALIQDHKSQQCTLVFLPSCTQAKRHEVLSILSSKQKLAPHQPTQSYSISNLCTHTPKADYLANFARIKEHILDGDTYQINYSQQFSGDFFGCERSAYLALRAALPSPYSAYIDLGREKVLSFSPERFITLTNNQALTQPIKGTAPRGKTALEDQQLANTLLASEKNRAENLMIVDLLRNDFSQSCLPHSVKTPKLFALESYANVHHLVSSVTGTLPKHVKPFEFLMQCFPGGSITGAPKKRSMEIISDLEQHMRRVYCGSIARLSVNGKMDSNIAIRTLLLESGQFYCWGGGGIVADSDAEEEYTESIQKVQLLLDTLKKGQLEPTKEN